MSLQTSETRSKWLTQLARRMIRVVGIISIAAVFDLVPEKFAEAAVGLALCLLLLAVISPPRLLRWAGKRTSTMSPGVIDT